MPQAKILVIRGGAIGDFILTLPVLAALREQFPAARLEVLGYPHIAQLALAGGQADEVRSIEAGALAGFFARDGKLHDSLQEYFAGFGLIISFLYDPDEILQTNVARCSSALFMAGPHRPEEAAGRHAAETFLKPLERLAIYEPDPVPQLKLPVLPQGVLHKPLTSRRVSGVKKLEASSRQSIRRTLALHPGSGSERKNWPEARWASLLHELNRMTSWSFLLVGGEAEGAKLDRLATAVPATRLQLARSLPLAELAGNLSSCDAFVGHDSGISHLAAALGMQTLVLWGDTVEAVWRPLGNHVTIVRAPGGLVALDMGTVLAQLIALV